MSRQFERQYEIQVGSILFSDLDVSFTVTKTLKPEPNTCDLIVYNLNPDNRKSLDDAESAVVRISAGYTDAVGMIFLGDLREIASTYEPPNWITRLGSGDGETAVRESRINRSFAAGTNLVTVLKKAAEDMGIGAGNLDQLAPSGSLVEAGQEFLNSLTLSGPAAREFDRIARSAGFEFSIQDGAIQLLEAGQTLVDRAYVLTPSSGLIGSPTLGSDGTITFRALLNSDIIPGRQIVLQTETIDERIRAERCTYRGDWGGNDWYIEGEGKAL